ncbi:uncharacterized protein LOC121796783 [Salvia splendens]|uniref:uncharacterized protein LOC121796783 n=1 Tax=Salvia splendens TaxID=180675 RepID=UPI001C27A8BA|nr:uncharacterized protein LOC121796783 [Salvia splendens]
MAREDFEDNEEMADWEKDDPPNGAEDGDNPMITEAETCNAENSLQITEFHGGFSNPGFDGADYTWAKNGLLERLDRVLVSVMVAPLFEAVRVTNLPRVASGNEPVLVRGKLPTIQEGGRAFRFQNMWVRHEGFADLVQTDWMAPTEAGGLLNLKIKLTRVKKTLKRWNKEVFGNIHANLKTCEENIAVAQSEFEENPSARNRMEINKQIAEYVLLLIIEEDFCRQKAALRWLEEGDINTRFYQSWVKHKKIRLTIHKINVNGRKLKDDREIRDSTVDFFQNLLAPNYPELAEPDLDLLHQLPFSEQLEDLPQLPSRMKLSEQFLTSREIVHPARMGSRPPSSKRAGARWGADVVDAVRQFFGGAYLPRSITATSIVLIPKKAAPET